MGLYYYSIVIFPGYREEGPVARLLQRDGLPHDSGPCSGIFAGFKRGNANLYYGQACKL